MRPRQFVDAVGHPITNLCELVVGGAVHLGRHIPCARQHRPDQFPGNAQFEKQMRTAGSFHGAFAIDAIPVLGTFRVDQLMLLVVPQRTCAYAAPTAQFTDIHDGTFPLDIDIDIDTMSSITVTPMNTASPVPVARAAVTIDDHERTLTVLGRAASPHPRPLLLVFHGSRQTADTHRRFTGNVLDPLAADGPTVVAYLDGYRGNWNDARRETFFPARLESIDDVAFVRAVVESLTESHGIDRDRVVLIGYSNGGQMVLRLLHETPDLAAAAIVISAAMPTPENFLSADDAPPARPTPLTLVHGTRDKIVPFEGGSVSRWAGALFKVGGSTRSAADTATYLARRNGISTPPTAAPLPKRAGSNGATSVIRIRHNEDSTPSVTLYEVRGAGHTIPGPKAAPRIMGKTNADISLLDLVADVMPEISRVSPRAPETP